MFSSGENLVCVYICITFCSFIRESLSLRLYFGAACGHTQGMWRVGASCMCSKGRGGGARGGGKAGGEGRLWGAEEQVRIERQSVTVGTC